MERHLAAALQSCPEVPFEEIRAVWGAARAQISHTPVCGSRASHGDHDGRYAGFLVFRDVGKYRTPNSALQLACPRIDHSNSPWYDVGT